LKFENLIFLKHTKITQKIENTSGKKVSFEWSDGSKQEYMCTVSFCIDNIKKRHRGLVQADLVGCDVLQMQAMKKPLKSFTNKPRAKVLINLIRTFKDGVKTSQVGVDRFGIHSKARANLNLERYI